MGQENGLSYKVYVTVGICIILGYEKSMIIGWGHFIITESAANNIGRKGSVGFELL